MSTSLLSPDRCGWLAACALALLASHQAQGIILDATGDTLANTTAPAGGYADSGWQWQGQFGSYLGTMIGPNHFLTAKHYGWQGNTFTSTSNFNGGSTVIYNVALDGLGQPIYTDIAGTDFRVVQVVETFASWATLYSGSGEETQEMVVMGRGGPRGAEKWLDSGSGLELKGWETGGSDNVARWGTNVVSQIIPDAFSPVGELLQFDFDHGFSANEGTLSDGDSGGGIFILDGGIWKLAGINYSVDGDFDTNNTIGDGQEFTGALFDMGGYYTGSDGTGWTLINDDAQDVASSGYGSRISTSAAAINAIAAVPEPESVMLLAAALIGLVSRRRRE